MISKRVFHTIFVICALLFCFSDVVLFWKLSSGAIQYNGCCYMQLACGLFYVCTLFVPFLFLSPIKKMLGSYDMDIHLLIWFIMFILNIGMTGLSFLLCIETKLYHLVKIISLVTFIVSIVLFNRS